LQISPHARGRNRLAATQGAEPIWRPGHGNSAAQNIDFQSSSDHSQLGRLLDARFRMSIGLISGDYSRDQDSTTANIRY